MLLSTYRVQTRPCISILLFKSVFIRVASLTLHLYMEYLSWEGVQAYDWLAQWCHVLRGPGREGGYAKPGASAAWDIRVSECNRISDSSSPHHEQWIGFQFCGHALGQTPPHSFHLALTDACAHNMHNKLPAGLGRGFWDQSIQEGGLTCWAKASWFLKGAEMVWRRPSSNNLLDAPFLLTIGIGSFLLTIERLFL